MSPIPSKLAPERYTFLEKNFNKYPMSEEITSTFFLYKVRIPMTRGSLLEISIVGHDFFLGGISKYCGRRVGKESDGSHHTFWDNEGLPYNS